MAQMSDDQVIQYVKDGQKSGKNQKQLITELTARGVTKQQAERIKERYEEGQGADVAVVDQSVASQQRERRQDASNEVTAGTFDVISTEVSDPTTKGTAAAARLVFGRNIFNSRNSIWLLRLIIVWVPAMKLLLMYGEPMKPVCERPFLRREI